MIIYRCGFNYEGLTSFPPGASRIIRNVFLQCSHRVLRQAKIFYTEAISAILLRSVKLVRGLDAVQNLPWAVISYSFVVLMDLPDQTYSMEQSVFF